MTPRVGVVVPTVDRLALLARCLRGLAGQDHPADEVVVVHDGAAGVSELLASWRGRLPLIELRIAAPGAGDKRNAGWRAVSADLVAFTDDDCEPTSGWLRALVAADADLMHGPVGPHPEDGEVRSVFARTLSVPEPGEHFPTANLAVRRSRLDDSGGFDGRLTAGEDTDLAWRLIESGTRPTWVPEALVHHAIRPATFPQHLRSLWRWRALPEVVRRHPQLREALPGKVFWKRSHPVALLALGALLSPWHRPAALLAAPLFLRHWRVSGPRWGTQTAVGDMAEVAVVLVGSVRARSLLL